MAPVIASSSILIRDGNAANRTGFCPDGGGTWPAVQSLIVFLITNIIAHAATIQIAAGSDTKSSVKRVMNAILLPVSAGDSAFRSLGRWFSRWRKSPKFTAILRGDKLEDATISGAVAISVPIEFAPLLVGRWELVDQTRKIVKFEDTKSWRPPGQIKHDMLTFRKPSAMFERYLPFILPPDVQFKGDYLSNEHTIPPSSSALSSIIGMVQIGLSIRQLSLQYGASITDKGLSSPYLAVIPYMLMSLVNLVANTLVGQYRRVTMLPMKEPLPEGNQVCIIKCLDKNCPGKRNCPTGHQRRVVSIKLSSPPEHSATASGDPKAAKEPKPAEGLEGMQAVAEPTSSPVEWCPDKGLTLAFDTLILIEFDGENWREFKAEPAIDEACVARKRVLNLYLIHLWRKQNWNRVYCQVSWKFEFGRYKKREEQIEANKNRSESNPSQSDSNELKRWRATFLKQKNTPKPHWGLMKRTQHNTKIPSKKIPVESFKKLTDTDYHKFEEWLGDNYPDITIDLSKAGRLRRKFGYSYLVSGVFLQFIATMLLGALTKFRLGNRNRAIWFLVWMYGGPMLRWSWLNDNSIDKVPCLAVIKWILFAIGRFLYFALLLVGVFGGISVICVELLEDICNKQLSLSTRVWLLVGSSIAIAVLVMYTAIIHFKNFACKTLKPALIEYFSFRC